MSDSHLLEVSDTILGIRADNPGPMTLTGTNSWVLRDGSGTAVVVDPGPALPNHLDRITYYLGSDRVAAVLLTHGHHDHSESATTFAGAVDAPVLAFDDMPGAATLATGRHDFGGLQVHISHTPGHTSDSVSVLVEQFLLTGDTILGQGTTVIAHPDGKLGEYLASLDQLDQLVAAQKVEVALPGHGPTVTDAAERIAEYRQHRHERLDQVAAATEGLSVGSTDELVDAVVAKVYADVPRQLWPAAALSVRAQVDYLSEQGRI